MNGRIDIAECEFVGWKSGKYAGYSSYWDTDELITNQGFDRWGACTTHAAAGSIGPWRTRDRFRCKGSCGMLDPTTRTTHTGNKFIGQWGAMVSHSKNDESELPTDIPTYPAQPERLCWTNGANRNSGIVSCWLEVMVGTCEIHHFL